MTLLQSFDLLTMLQAMAVCFLAGLIGGVSGFGAGLLVTMFILPIIGPKALIPVASVLMLINNGSRVWFFRTDLDVPTVIRITVIALPTALLGALIYVRMNSATIQVLLGVTLIATIPIRRWITRRKLEPNPAAVVAIGGIFGFLSSLIVGAGMLVIPLLLGLGLSGPALIATDAAIAVLVNLWKVLLFGSLDALTRDLFIFAVLLGLCTIPGTACAAWIVRRTDIKIHSAIVEALVFVGGVIMIIEVLRSS